MFSSEGLVVRVVSGRAVAMLLPFALARLRLVLAPSPLLLQLLLHRQHGDHLLVGVADNPAVLLLPLVLVLLILLGHQNGARQVLVLAGARPVIELVRGCAFPASNGHAHALLHLVPALGGPEIFVVVFGWRHELATFLVLARGRRLGLGPGNETRLMIGSKTKKLFRVKF